MTYRHNNTPRPPQTNADVMAAFADWLRDNPGVRPVITAADAAGSYAVDGYDEQDADMLEMSDGEATYRERVLGIAS